MSRNTGLKTDYFQNFVCKARNKMKNNEFCDVTLVSEDYQQFQAHKVILSSTSKFFNQMLKNKNHPHPLIYMRGISSADMGVLIDFLYDGEAKIELDNSAQGTICLVSHIVLNVSI